MLSIACAGQAQQFRGAPDVELTGGRVTSLLTGNLQYPTSGGADILYINASALINNNRGIPTLTVVAGEDLNSGSGNPEDLGLNHISFTDVSNVVAALGKFAGTNNTDYAFALSPAVAGGANTLCVYYGTGAIYNSQLPSYNGGSVYPPTTGGTSGCMTFSTVGTATPNFAYIAALPFMVGGLPQILVEDIANSELYIFSNSGATGYTLPGIRFLTNISLAATGGTGPIYTGSFDNKYSNFDKNGNAFFIINGQAGHSATVYLGDGNGGFTAQPPLTFTNSVYSMLEEDMDNDGIPDMVVEGSKGAIEIFRGNGDGTFGTISIGGTSASPSALAGNGGQLAAIDPNSLNILTTTPIGLSVLQNGGSGSLNYTLKGIYNIGPGRSSYALAQIFNTTSYPDFVVDSPEGVAIVQGDSNGDGGFETSNAYSSLAPALGATVGQFRTPTTNPTGCLDVAVATGATAGNAVQGQLLTGNLGSGGSCNGTFNTFNGITNTSAGPSGLQTGLWSNIVSGDFNGDGKPDLAYSLTGYPLPTSATTNVPGLFVQFGNGDGTFQAPAAMSVGAPNSNLFYGESAVGTFDARGNADIANIDAGYDDTLLGQSGGSFSLGLNQSTPGNTSFNQVAAGFFAPGRTNNEDLVFQNGTNLVPYVNNLDGTGKKFTAKTPLTGPSGSYAISTVLLTDVTDNNGTGNGDILALYHNTASTPANPSASTPNLLYIWVGIGDGTFNAPKIVTLSRNFYMAAVADMNGDGLPDLVLSDGYVVGILYNQGSGSFISDFTTCPLTIGTNCPGHEQHFLAGQGINSLLVQSVRGGGRPDVVAANGGATISNPVVLLGNSGQSSLSLAANPVVNTGGITVLLDNVTSLPTTGTLTSSPPTSAYGAAFTITATLTSTASVAPAGLVTFSIDGTLLGSAALYTVPGSTTTSSASVTVPLGNTYPTGTYTLTATFPGDTSNSAKILSGTHNITGAGTTTEISFCIGPAVGCPAPPAVTTPTPLYVPNLTMSYGEYWNGIIQTSSSTSSAMTGNVDLNDDYNGVTSTLCVLPVTGGACPTSVGTTQGTSVGTNILTGVYLGDASHQGSTSQPVTITVSPDTTTAALSGPTNPTPQGQPVTLTAALTGNYAAPTGPVVFMNGSTQLCSSPLSPSSTGVSSTATCTTSALPAGTDTITASYAATLDFLAASATTQETINALIPPTFAITVTPNPVSVGVGEPVVLTVTMTPQDGFAEGVNLSCGSMPSEASCIFVQGTIASGGGSVPLGVETTSPHSCNDNAPYFVGGNGGGPGLAPFALPALAGLVAFFLPGRRRWLRALLAAVLLAGATQITGCGNCTDLGTKPGTYTFQVIGTSTGTGQVQSQTVTLSITI